MNLKGHILVKGSPTPSIVPQKISVLKILRFPPKRPGDWEQQHRRGPKKNTKNTAVPLEDLRCRHRLPVILLLRNRRTKTRRKRRFRRMTRRSLWSGLLWFPSWCFCWNVFVGTKSQRNNIFQTILSMYFPKTYPRFAMALKDKALRIVSIPGTSVEDSLCLFRTSACQSQLSLTSGWRPSEAGLSWRSHIDWGEMPEALWLKKTNEDDNNNNNKTS